MESAASSDNNLDRRQAERLLLRLDVEFAIPGGQTLPCMAGDFSLTDNILRLDAQQALPPLAGQAEGTLLLAAGTGLGADIEVPARVLRVEEQSLVITLDQPSEAALDLLRGAAVAAPLTEAQIRERQAGFAPEYSRILPELRATVVRATAQLAGDFVKLAEERLLEALRDARNNREQTLFNEAHARFGRRKAQIVRQTVETLARAVDILDDPLLPTDSERHAQTSDLSLVELADFEEFLTVSQLAGGLEQRLKAVLEPLHRRLSYLAQREMDDASSPLGPRLVCEAFADAMKGLLNNNEVSGVVYESLREVLQKELGDVHTRVNSLLSDRGVLSVIEPQKFAIRKLPPRGARGGAGGAAMVPEQTGESTGGAAYDDPGEWGAQGQPYFPAGAGPATPGAQTLGRHPGVYPAGMIGPSLFGSTLAAEIWAGGGPPLGQVLSLAQHQLALRRQLQSSEADGEFPAPAATYSADELLAALGQLQYSLAEAPAADPLYVENIKHQLSDALRARSGSGKTIGQSASDGLEIVGTLFQSLLQDAEVGEYARGNLRRLQGLVHKAAIRDQALFASKDHPLLGLLERVARIEEDPAEGKAGARARLQEIIGQVNRAYDGNPAIVETLLGELDNEIGQQEAAFSQGLEASIRHAEEQQRLLRERRERAGEPPPAEPRFPPELERWVSRAKSLRAGARLLMNANTAAPYVATLAWIGDDFNPYVLVDGKGSKIAALTLQQVVMYLRRGLMRILREQQDTAIDRALFGVVNRLHRQVVDQATHDSLTNLYTRKAFLQAVEDQLPAPDPEGQAPEAVLCELVLANLRDINARHGQEAGDQVIRDLSEELLVSCDPRRAVIGRLSGDEWGIYWPQGGLDKAQQEIESLIERLSTLEIPFAPDVRPLVVAGVAGVDPANPLLGLVVEAAHTGSQRARQDHGERVVIAGADERKRLQLEQIANYVARAVERERLILMYHGVQSLEQGTPVQSARVIVAAEDRAGKLIPPQLFSQALVNTDSAFEVDMWALRALLRWIEDHDEESEKFAFFIVPLSRRSLETDGIASLIINEFMNVAVPPSRLCFSLDDRVAHANLPEAVELIGALREFGCRFVLADFAGAQGDHSYVRELAVDFIEITVNFPPGRGLDGSEAVIARSVNDLAHFMGKRTIARADIAPSVLDLLRKMNFDFVHDTAQATRLRVRKDA